MGDVPEGAILSEDGYYWSTDGRYWWDESQQVWQPADPQPAAEEPQAEQAAYLDPSEIPFLMELSAYSSDESGVREFLASIGFSEETLSDDAAYA